MKKILLIQTAFIGDVILATSLLEKLHRQFPQADLDLFVRKGNETLFEGHPFLRKCWIWEKKKNKFRNLIRLVFAVRNERYDLVINLQRFFSTGFLTVASGGRITIGFDKNPLSFFFSKSVSHRISAGQTKLYEVERNHALVVELTDNQWFKPKIYPPEVDLPSLGIHAPFCCIAPASVWFTKQWPVEKWVATINQLPASLQVVLLGAKEDRATCEKIIERTTHQETLNLAGQLNLLQSAAVMKNARMNFVNDSAPLHLASAVNAPVTAIFCSTVPAFGFTPLSDNAHIVETREKLPCRPCGLHGKKSCPLGHFNCAEIGVEELLEKITTTQIQPEPVKNVQQSLP
jgi:heptosyltransferase-2